VEGQRPLIFFRTMFPSLGRTNAKIDADGR
jgi:hypothetical protein